LTHRHTPINQCWKKCTNQSHYIEVEQGTIFYGTEYEIWADFGLVGNTEKKRFWADYEKLLRAVFSFFQGQKKI
jgi:hypothetical protein